MAAVQSSVKPAEILASAGVIFAVVAGVLYFEASYLSDMWADVGAARVKNAKSEQEVKSLDDDEKDIERAKPHILDAFRRLGDGTLRPAANHGAAALPSLADIPLQRAGVQGGTGIPSVGVVFNTPQAAREPLPPQLSGLDQAGIIVSSQPAPTDKGDHTRVFDAVSAEMEFNRFMPILDGLEKNLPLMVVEELRASLPQNFPAFSPKPTTLDLRFRLRFPVTDSAENPKLAPKKGAASATPPVR